MNFHKRCINLLPFKPLSVLIAPCSPAKSKIESLTCCTSEASITSAHKGEEGRGRRGYTSKWQLKFRNKIMGLETNVQVVHHLKSGPSHGQIPPSEPTTPLRKDVCLNQSQGIMRVYTRSMVVLQSTGIVSLIL